MSKENPLIEASKAVKKVFDDIEELDQRLRGYGNWDHLNDLGHERMGALRVVDELEKALGVKFGIKDIDRDNPLREVLLEPSETTRHGPPPPPQERNPNRDIRKG